MSNAPGPATALPPAGSDALTADVPDQGQARPGLGSEALSADSWVKALFAFSQTVVARPRSQSQPASTKAPTAGETTESIYSLADAAPQLANPLSPLRDRDRQALAEIFAHDHMASIEADILTRLSYLVPEPPWEVEPYEFLRELLEL